MIPDLNLPTVEIDGYQVPVLKHLAARILREVETHPTSFDMEEYHARYCDTTINGKKAHCGTIHCVAGWGIHLCGAQGYQLEEDIGDSWGAANRIFRASGAVVPPFMPDDYAPEDRFDSTDEHMAVVNLMAIEALRKLAALDPLPEGDDVDESDYRKAPEFLEAQERAVKAYNVYQTFMHEIQRRWPARDGWYWSVNAGGSIGQYYAGVGDE